MTSEDEQQHLRKRPCCDRCRQLGRDRLADVVDDCGSPAPLNWRSYCAACAQRKLENYFLGEHPKCKQCHREGHFWPAQEVATNDSDNPADWEALCQRCGRKGASPLSGGRSMHCTTGVGEGGRIPTPIPRRPNPPDSAFFHGKPENQEKE